MSSPKEEVGATLENLRDNAIYEGVQYHLYVLEKVKRGLDRAESEGITPHDDAKARLGKWLSS